MKKQLVKAQIIGHDATPSKSSALTRGLIGGALFGPLGAFGGALTGKTNRQTTFLLIYDDGSKSTMTCKVGGMIYNSYLPYLEV